MRPTKTTYYLVTEPFQEKICKQFYRAAEPDVKRIRLGFPTVYAQRNGKMIGLLSTIPVKDRICAGPLVIDPTLKNPAFITVRLCEAYEHVLKSAGVTMYTFSVDAHKSGWARTLERLGFTLYKQTKKLFCYKRQVT